MDKYCSKVCSCGEEIDAALESALKAVRYDEQKLTEGQKARVRENIGVDLTGYATEEFVTNKIAEAELGGEEVDLSGYAQKSELPTKVSQLENDKGYLTEHQDISGKLDASALPTAINTALAQAKASGEFDGKDGVDGKDGQDGYTPQKNVDYFDGQSGKDGVDGKDGTSVTHSWSGTTLIVTSASGTTSANLKGDKGDKGDTGGTGAAGTSVTVKSVSESTTDGGNNVVTFSDNKTLTVKNGKDGHDPVRGIDYWTEADQEAIVQQVITALGTPVFGRVDADNNIILTGELADGTYTIKYEDADGNMTEIGTIEVGGAAYTNLADPTSDEWAVDKRLNSSAILADATGCRTTNYFSCVKGDVIRIKGLDIRYTNSEQSQNARTWFFNADGGSCVGSYPASDPKFVFDGTDMFTITLDGLTNISGGSEEEIVRGRFSGMLFDGYTDEDVIITVNQEIE